MNEKLTQNFEKNVNTQGNNIQNEVKTNINREKNVKKSINNLSNEKYILNTNLPENYPKDSVNYIKFMAKDNNNSIITGNVNLTIRTYDENNTVADIVNLGNYEVINGTSLILFNSSMENFPKYTPGIPVEFKFNFINKENNDTQVLIQKTKFMDDYYVFWEGVNQFYSLGDTIYNTFHVGGDYDSVVTLYVNGKKHDRRKSLDDGSVAVMKYNIPMDYYGKANNYGNIYLIAKGTTKEGFNTSYFEKKKDVWVNTEYTTKILGPNRSGYAGKTVQLICGVMSDHDCIPIKTGHVVIKLNGRSIASFDLNGTTHTIVYDYKIPNYQAKKYALQYVYVENDLYSRFECNKYLIIRNQSANFTSHDVVSYQGDTIKIHVNITGKETGIPAEAGTVGFKLNGKTAKINGKAIIEKVKNGSVTFTYKIPKNMKAGNYKIFVTYSGGRNLYETRRTTGVLTVKDHTLQLSTKAKWAYNGRKTNITCNVYDSIAKVTDGDATLKIDGKNFAKSKINNGYIIFSIQLPNNFLGKHIMEIIAYNKYHDVNSTKTTLTVINP